MGIVRLLVVVMVFCGSSSAEETARYFKEDHYTGAEYMVLASNGSYTLTAREHMFVGVEQAGHWSKSGEHFTFTPSKSGKPSFKATQVRYGGRIFLALDEESGPSIAVPIDKTKKDLDHSPKVNPPYVFFEISATEYCRETNDTYPFRTLSKAP